MLEAMRVVIGALILFLTLDAFSCDCEAINSASLEKWKDYFDVIIEGRFKEVLSADSDQRQLMNQRGEGGTNILFEVIRVFKGSADINSTIAILQFNEGNCTEFFDAKSSFIVFGRTVSQILCSESTDDNQGDNPPPPPPGLNSGRLYSEDCDHESLTYWNAITKQQLTIATNMCTKFLANSKTGKLVKNSF